MTRRTSFKTRFKTERRHWAEKPNKCQPVSWERNSTMESLHEMLYRLTKRQIWAAFGAWALSRSPSPSLPLCLWLLLSAADIRSKCGAQSVFGALISWLSHISFSFSICVEKFIHASLLFLLLLFVFFVFIFVFVVFFIFVSFDWLRRWLALITRTQSSDTANGAELMTQASRLCLVLTSHRFSNADKKQ